MAVLEVKSLCKQYTKVLAANNVSFSIDEGEIFALIGPNGRRQNDYYKNDFHSDKADFRGR